MKRVLGILLIVVAVAAIGCGAGKGAADLAVKAAQTAFDATKDQAMKIAPAEATGIQDAITAAKAAMDAGNYQAAIDSAKAIPAKVTALSAGLAAKKAELEASWGGMKDLPKLVDAFKAKVDKLSATKKLPAGIDAAAVATAKTALATVTQNWTEAQAAFQDGRLAEATTKAGDAKATLEHAMTAIKMTAPVAMK